LIVPEQITRLDYYLRGKASALPLYVHQSSITCGFIYFLSTTIDFEIDTHYR